MCIQFWTAQAATKYLKPGASIQRHLQCKGINLLQFYMIMPLLKAIISLTKVFLNLENKGIRVNSVAPGPFWSPLQISGGQPQSAIPEFGKLLH